MASKDKDQLGEYEAAMLLPHNEHTALLHKYAAEHQQMHCVDLLESTLQTAQLMRQRWEQDLPYAGSEGFRPFVGSREAARMCVLTESLQRKLAGLRDRSYWFARIKLFNHHGVRIDFPTGDAAMETAPVAITPAPVEPVAETAPASAVAPAPEARTASAERLVVKRDVKAQLQRLHEKGVKGADLQAFKKRCLAGNVTDGQMRQWAQELLAACAA